MLKNTVTPITKENAEEKGRAGGKTGKGKPDSVYKIFSKIKYCSPKCPYYQSCPFVTVAQAQRKKECVVKKHDEDIQNFFLNIFAGGEEGMTNELLAKFVIYWLKIGKSPSAKDIREFLAIGLQMKKGIYGDKQKIEHSGEMKVEIKKSIAERIKEYNKYYEDQGIDIDGTKHTK